MPDHKVYLTEKKKKKARLAGEFLKEYITNNEIDITNSTMLVSLYTRTRATAIIINDILNIKKVKKQLLKE